MSAPIKAMLFDVFGTVVDWRTSVAGQLQEFFNPRGVSRDWNQFILDWRAMYQPAMHAVRSGTRDFVILDTLHRENLLQLLEKYEIYELGKTDIDQLVSVWHRLSPWPDSAPGLARLKQKFILATCSNGNISLMVNLARFGSLPWDAILGAEVTRAYKPDPKVYLGSVASLGLSPSDCVMVAAHNDDLFAAQAVGLGTAFVARPTEYGLGQAVDLVPEANWDYVSNSMTGLADIMLAD